MRETLKDVSLRVSDTDTTEAFNVAGRGEMHLSILIETMRREGYEFQVSPAGALPGDRRGEVRAHGAPGGRRPRRRRGGGHRSWAPGRGPLEMTPVGTRMKLEFLVPARGLFGYRNEFLTDTRGRGSWPRSLTPTPPSRASSAAGTPAASSPSRTGESVTYGLWAAQEQGALFIGPGIPRLRRHGGGGDPQERGHHRQRLPEKAADQHAGLRL